MISEELLEKYRFINVEDIDWSDFIQQDFIKDMCKIGIEVERIYFDVPGSQGDGACFDGHVYDWGLFLKSLGYDSPVLIEHAQNYWAFGAKHKGHYCHNRSVNFNVDVILPDRWDKEEFIYQFSPYPEDDVRSHAWYAILETFDSDKLQDEFIEVFQDHMDALYKRLEEEFSYLISDEAVTETIVANGFQEMEV